MEFLRSGLVSFVSSSSKPPTTTELYGDIEIETNGEPESTDYLPAANTMIKLTKKYNSLKEKRPHF